MCYYYALSSQTQCGYTTPHSYSRQRCAVISLTSISHLALRIAISTARNGVISVWLLRRRFYRCSRACYSHLQGFKRSSVGETEYREAMGLLQSLAMALRMVHDFLVGPRFNDGTQPPPPDVALMNGLRYHLECCQRLMDVFVRQTATYV